MNYYLNKLMTYHEVHKMYREGNSIRKMVKIARGRIKLNMAAQPKDLEIVVSEDRSTDFQYWLNS